MITITVSTPSGTRGIVSVPSSYASVQLDGTKVTSINSDSNDFIVSGGKHTIVAVQYTYVSRNLLK